MCGSLKVWAPELDYELNDISVINYVLIEQGRIHDNVVGEFMMTFSDQIHSLINIGQPNAYLIRQSHCINLPTTTMSVFKLVRISFLEQYAKQIIIISHHTKFELASSKH